MAAAAGDDGERLPATGYLAAPGFEDRLRAELGDVSLEHGRLMLAPGPSRPAVWALDTWLEPRLHRVASIGDAARRLRAVSRRWVPYPVHLHRRTALIAEALPRVSLRPVEFPGPDRSAGPDPTPGSGPQRGPGGGPQGGLGGGPKGEPAGGPQGQPRVPLGSFTLLEENVVLASARCTSPFPNGEPRWVEDRLGPPSRAYLKLWEALTLLGAHPGRGERCLDAGAAPGGWTWALARLGARVLAVDRAPLDASVAALPGVEEHRGTAFDLQPARDGPFEWIFCDAASPPAKLLEWVLRWVESGRCERFVCTVKLRASLGDEVLREFAAIPGGRLVHLSANRHEVTWLRAGRGAGAGRDSLRRDRPGPGPRDAS